MPRNKSAQVITLIPNKNDSNDDPVFFEKEKIYVGQILTYHGKRNSKSKWEVVAIRTKEKYVNNRGRASEKEVDIPFVRKFTDFVHFRAAGRGNYEFRLTYSYLKYSSIWRIS